MKSGGKPERFFVKSNYLPILILCAVGALLSYFMGHDRYSQRIILLVVLWAAASSSFNIISGYAGQVVFGYMMFVGAGAYTTVLLFKFCEVTPWIGMWAGVVIAGVTALIIGLPTLRLHGAFFAVATVAFPLITIPVLNQLGLEELSIPFTGHGAESMQFRDMRFYVLIAIVLLGIVLAVVQMMERSRFGFSLRALKQNEDAAEGMGVNTYWIKLMAFVLSACLGALMGTVYSFGLLYVVTTHAVFGLFIIVRILSITLVGGVATMWGPLIAACILVPTGEFLNSQFGDRYPGVQDIIYGVALIASILYMPEGIWGKMRKVFRIHRSRSDLPMIVRASGDYEQKFADSPGSQEMIEITFTQPGGVQYVNEDPVILKIEDVNKFFGGVSALYGLNVQIPRGKVIGIIGPNGSGKTTLFNVINGYLTPEKGRIIFEGRDITHFKPHASCRLGIGRTFQVPQVFTNMTVVENIAIGALSRWENIRRAYAAAEEIALQMGLSKRAYVQAVGLTMWETKILEFSRALATRPRLLLVDEPMAGLNPEETVRIGNIIRAIANNGISVIVIEHVVQSLVRIADLMIGLDNGSKVAEGPPAEVISDSHIIEAYLGAKWKDRHAGH